MKKELENGKSDFMCFCKMCSNYTNCLASVKAQEKFILKVCLDKSSAEVFTWVTAILIGVFLGYAG